MEPHGRLSFLGTCAGIVIISCCFLGIMGEIKDGFVYTDLLKTVRKGDKTSLKCEFLGAPVAVFWKKGNDPHKSTTLITWLDGKKWQGACAENNWCDSDENFSLIIRNVTIADTGRYICRVSNYLGHLIHNYTDLHISEPPEEPYPVIKECSDSSALGKDYGCVIPSPTPINLTCSASGFYPDLDLFFLYGSEKINSVEIQEWINEDGTISKSVSISAVPHDTPYVCVASDVPGNQKERAVTVFVSPAQKDDTSTASAGSTTKPPQDINDLIIIIVPSVFVAVTGACILVICWRKHHQNDRRHDAESVPLMEIGPITVKKLSFYDLWVMVSKATASDLAKLSDTLRELGITRGQQEKFTHRDAYRQLCQWKSRNVDDNHLQILLDALKKSEYAVAWNNICDVRKESATISEGTLKYILSQIGDPRKIDKFLSELIPGRPVMNFDKITKSIEEPLGELMEWSKRSVDVNPFVLLSLALESAGCSPVDRTFFFVKRLSFYDLWVMVSKATASDMAKLHDTLRELGITRGQQEKLTNKDAYQQLCQWKSDNVDGNHSQMLLDALKKSEYAIAWDYICDVRKESATISEGTLKYILSQIEDPRKIDKFLSELIPGRPVTNFDKIAKSIDEPLGELEEWSKGSVDVNPFVLLSLALESVGCSPVDRTFFLVPDKPVSSDKVQLFVKRLTRRHCERLANITKLTRDEISLIVVDNQNDLFDTESMITDWLAQEHISNIDKRRELHFAVTKIRRDDLKDYFGRYDYSTKLPDTKDAEYTIMESSYGALIPSERKEDVYLVELADIAFRLMMMDVYPLADALKISNDKLKQYKRKSLSKNKLSRGTIGILEKVCQNTKYARSKLCDSLVSVAGLQELAHLLRYGYQVSHSDLFSVAQGGEAGKEQCARIRENLGIISEAEDTLDMLRNWRSMIHSPTYNLKEALADAVFPVLGKKKALDILSGAVISSGIQSGNVISFIGDNILCNQASNIADILGVKHSSSERMKVILVLNVWKDSVKTQELNDAQRGQLCKRLNDKGFKTFSSKLRQGELFIEVMERAIQCDVTAGLAEILDVKLSSEQTPNVKEILQKWEEKLRKKSLTQEERIDLSNKLFKEGYTDFSLEIMMGFVPKPMETT